MNNTFEGSTNDNSTRSNMPQCRKCGAPLDIGCEHSQESKIDLQENLSIQGPYALIEIKIPGLPDRFEAGDKVWIKKDETHVTLVGFATQLHKKIIAQAKETGEKISRKEAQERIKNALVKAAEGIKFKVVLKDELRLAERGENDRSIIQMCEVLGIEEYFDKITAALGLETGTIELPPTHVTLYTGENNKAIGLPTDEILRELTRELTQQELEEINKKLQRDH